MITSHTFKPLEGSHTLEEDGVGGIKLERL